MKKILLITTAVMLLLISTAVTALADDTTTTGEGDISATVPVEGTIEALEISVTHPVTLAYTIDPNTGVNGDFIAPDIPITNNTKVPVNITVQSLTSAAGGTLQFTDVAPEAQDWANLSLADSKTYLALGIKVKDADGWNAGYDENTHYAVEADPTLFGSLPADATGTMKLEASFGLAFDQSYTAMHSLVFMFNLV
jgi:hypothetical protein